MIEQGSQEWFAARLGKVTASRVKDVLAKTKSGPSASRKNYMMELLCQRLTGHWGDSYTNSAMLRGIELEPVARSAYELHQGVVALEAEFVVHPVYPDMGASPDGYVGDDGLIEIKCPNTAQHVACIQSGKFDQKYWQQMQFQLACTGRQWCDFVSFDDRMPEPLQLFVCRVDRDDGDIADMMKDVLSFLSELQQLENDLMEKMG